MTFIPAPLTARVAMLFRQNGQRVENVYHVLYTATPTDADLGTACDVFKDWWDTNVKAGASEQLSLIEVDATNIEDEGGNTVILTEGLPIAGTNAGEPMPNNVTVAIKWTTGFGGRSKRGRTYHLGLVRTELQDNDPNLLEDTMVDALTDQYNQLIEDVATNTAGQLAVCSYRFNNAPRTSAVVTPILAASLVDNVVDSQRRRLPGRGS